MGRSPWLTPFGLLAKIPADVRDIGDLLQIANRLGLNVAKHKPYISQSFRESSYERITEFIDEHPQYTSWWLDLGLEGEL